MTTWSLLRLLISNLSTKASQIPSFLTWLTDSSCFCRNPFAKVSSEGSHYLEPRTSFKRWGETIAGMSNEWTEDQRKSLRQTQIQVLTLLLVEAALVLSTVYSRLIEMWRDKNTASEAARIALIRESTHECKLYYPRLLFQSPSVQFWQTQLDLLFMLLSIL